MNTPNQTTITQQNIALNLLCPSLTNPRKRFDDGKLRELAASIKNQGVLQPLLVRQRQGKMTKTTWPFPTADDNAIHYEIVAGERRYRAAKIAELAEVPCFVRELTDLQVLHAQVIENLQRDDLHPLEEADGYAKLMKDHGATAGSLAAEIGKSKAYIYARLKFIDLCPEAREAFFSGQMEASTALLVARIPVQKLQIQAVKEITRKLEYGTPNTGKGDNAMSYRRARDYIQDNFMLDLDRAPFDIKDADLSPKAGSCIDCKERTGNQPELFDDVSSKDVCTNPVCHAVKKTAHVLAYQKKVEADGNKFVAGKDAKKLIPEKYNSIQNQLKPHGFATLDSKVPNDDQNRSYHQVLTEAKLLSKSGESKVQKVIIENPNQPGEMIQAVNIEAATKALREAGFEIKPIHAAKNNNNTSRDKAKIRAKVEQAIATRKRLFDAIHNKIKAGMQQTPPHVPEGLYRILAETCLEQLANIEEAKFLAELYMPGVIANEDALEVFQSGIKLLSVGELFLLSIDCIMSSELIVNQWNVDRSSPEQMLAIAVEIGIDAAAIEKEVIAESNPDFKKAAKPASSVVKKAEAKPISTPSPAAQAQVKPTPKKPKAAPANVKAAVKPKSKTIAKAALAA